MNKATATLALLLAACSSHSYTVQDASLSVAGSATVDGSLAWDEDGLEDGLSLDGGLTVSAGANVCPSEALCLPLEVSVYLDGEATEGGEVSVCLMSPIGEQCETRQLGGQDENLDGESGE